jgi:hypothetical protein
VKENGHLSRLLLPVCVGITFACLLVWSFTVRGKDPFIISQSESISRVLTNNIRQIHDHSITGSRLFSKRSSENQRPATGENLWLQETNGHERCIAENIVRASFSPDGQKISYTTGDCELVIETLEGKRLASLARARDPVWSSDSASVTFSAIPALDYPDLQETVIYDLNSGQIARSTNGD